MQYLIDEIGQTHFETIIFGRTRNKVTEISLT